MRRLRILTSIALAIALVAGFDFLQKSSPARNAVFALEEEWTKALVRRDTTAFKRLTTPGFVYTEDNVVMTQGELIHAVVTGDKVEWAGNEEMKFYDYSPAAVVTGILVVQSRDKSNKAYTNRYRFTDTWLYRNGRWQAIAAQDYLIPK